MTYKITSPSIRDLQTPRPPSLILYRVNWASTVTILSKAPVMWRMNGISTQMHIYLRYVRFMIEIMLVPCIISKIKQLEAMIVHKCSLHTKHLDKMRHGFQSFHFFISLIIWCFQLKWFFIDSDLSIFSTFRQWQ